MGGNAGEDNSEDHRNGPLNQAGSHELLKPRESASPEPEGAAIQTKPESTATPSEPEVALKPTNVDPGEGLLLPSGTDIWTRTMPVVAIVVQVAVIVWLIVILVHNIWLSGVNHTLSNADKYLYTTGIAALAHLISAFTIGQIRSLWLKDLTEGSRPRATRLSRTRVLLSIGTIQDQGKAYEMTFSLIAFGLFATAFIGAMTIAQKGRTYVQLGELFGGANAPPTDCWTITTSPNTSTISWNNFGSNGTFYALNEANRDSFCPQALFSSVSKTNTALNTAAVQDRPGPGPGAGGYVGFGTNTCQGALGGVVECNAIGALVSIYPTCNILRSFNCTTAPLGTSACVPVYGSSSVRCSAAGQISASQGVINAITTDSCSVGFVNNTSQNAFLMNSTLSDYMIGACTSDQTVGDTIFVIGSINATISQRLASLMNEPNSQNISEYSVQCTLSMSENDFDFRKVSIFEDEPVSYLGGHQNIVNSTGELCSTNLQQQTLNSFPVPAQAMTSKSQVLNDNTRATAGMMMSFLFNQPLLDVITFGNGHNETIPNAFNSSNNQLEDFLGVTVATYMSYYWSIGIDFRNETNLNSQDFRNSIMGYPIFAEVPSFRIGSGQAWQVVYLLPSIGCIIALVVLLLRTESFSLPKRD